MQRHFWILILLAGIAEHSFLSAAEPLSVPAVLVAIQDVQVSAEDAALVRELHVAVGQEVQAGALLLTLSDAEARLAVRRADAELRIAQQAASNTFAVQLAEKSLAVAAAELRRAEETNQGFPGTVSASEVDRLRLAQERADLEVKQAQELQRLKQLEVETRQTEVELARQRLERLQIKAPCAGVVVELPLQPGEWLPLGAPCCRILDVSRLRAEATVDAARTHGLAEQPVKLQITLGDDQLTAAGRVTFVHPQVMLVNRTCVLWAEFDNSQGELRPGMAGNLLIPIASNSADSASSAQPE